MTPKQQKIVGYAVVALLAVLILMYVIKYVKLKFAELEQQHITPIQAVKNLAVNPVTICTKGNEYPLQQGSCGSNVVALQRWLNTRGYVVKVDGKFGPKTKSFLSAATGRTTVTEADSKTMVLVGVPVVPVPGNALPVHTQAEDYPKDLTAFAIAVQTDLDRHYLFGGRKKEGVWAQMLLLNPADLKAVAAYISRTYGKSLFSQIEGVQWNITDDTDLLLKNKLKAVGLGS